MSSKGRLFFRIFLIWNAIRFATVGVLVHKANVRNHKELNGIIDDCCDCYYVSKESHMYDIDPHKRFDLSYCIPQCTDCNWCDYIKNHDETAAAETCEWDGYKQAHSWLGLGIYMFPSLSKETGCTEDNISITSMHIFAKKYLTYGRWALSLGIIYAVSMLVLFFGWSDKYEYVSLIVFIYNYIIAEIDLYWIFKPYQYYRKQIPYNGDIIECEIDSIDEKAEDVLTVLLVITFSLLALQMIYCVMVCCNCCFAKCCCNNIKQRRSTTDLQYRAMRGSVSAEQKRCNCGLNSCFCDWDFIIFYAHMIVGIIVFLLMIFFAGLLIWSFYVMIKAGSEGNQDYENEKLAYICIVNVLLFLSLWDILLFPFCWQGARFICKFIVNEFGSISRSIN